jgi:hypothetical protein
MNSLFKQIFTYSAILGITALAGPEICELCAPKTGYVIDQNSPKRELIEKIIEPLKIPRHYNGARSLEYKPMKRKLQQINDGFC